MTRTLLVATAGGHLDELQIIVEQLGVDVSDAVWVTSKNAQTESLLADHEVAWVPPVGSGKMWRAARALPAAIRLHRRIRPELLVSTGALFSTPHLAAARLAGCETWFIDSATRVHGPSSTGKFAQRFTKAQLFVQGDGWGDDAWKAIPGVFDAFVAAPRAEPIAASGIRRAVVSLGSELWSFERAVDRVLELMPDVEIVWQTGVTEATFRGQHLRQWVPAAELREAVGNADVVVMHAGVGSALVALDHGKVPVILPRLSAHREMVDDHQVEFAEMIAARGLAVSVSPSDLTLAHLERAASLSVHRRRSEPL